MFSLPVSSLSAGITAVRSIVRSKLTVRIKYDLTLNGLYSSVIGSPGNQSPGGKYDKKLRQVPSELASVSAMKGAQANASRQSAILHFIGSRPSSEQHSRIILKVFS
jgi:hypothetical protein